MMIGMTGTTTRSMMMMTKIGLGVEDDAAKVLKIMKSLLLAVVVH